MNRIYTGSIRHDIGHTIHSIVRIHCPSVEVSIGLSRGIVECFWSTDARLLFANPSHVGSFLPAPFSSCSCALGCLRTPSRSPPCLVNNANEVRLTYSQVHLLISLSQGSGMLTSLCNSNASEVAGGGRIWYLGASNSTSRWSLTEFPHCFCGCKKRGVPYVDSILP